MCMKKVSMKEVFVDEYMKEICHKSSKDLVQLNADGGWNEVEDKNDQAEEIGENKMIKNIITIQIIIIFYLYGFVKETDCLKSSCCLYLF